MQESIPPASVFAEACMAESSRDIAVGLLADSRLKNRKLDWFLASRLVRCSLRSAPTTGQGMAASFSLVHLRRRVPPSACRRRGRIAALQTIRYHNFYMFLP